MVMPYKRLKIITFVILIGVSFCWVSCNWSSSNSKNSQVNAPLVLQANENQGNYGGMFDISEMEIVPSPDTVCKITFPKQEEIIDYSMSPKGSHVAMLIEQQGRYDIKFWSIGASEISDVCVLPKNFKAETVVWHPRASALFVLGTENATSLVYRVEKTNESWTVESIFSSQQKLKNMVVCPQPFITDYKYYSYRLFLGMDNGNDTYRIVSVTEQGKRFYQVIGPEKTKTTEVDGNYVELPSDIKSAYALLSNQFVLIW